MTKKRNKTVEVFGYTIELPSGKVKRPPPVDVNATGDYGHDPLPDGMFRMVPSGDIVDYAEMMRRLQK